MIRGVLGVGLLFLLALAVLGAPRANAGGEVWQSTFAMPADGGTLPAAAAINKRATYAIDCTSEACYKLCTSATCTPDCAKDAPALESFSRIKVTGGTGDGGTTYYTSTTHFRVEFESAGYSYVNILPAAAADPVCKLRLVPRNPSNFR